MSSRIQAQGRRRRRVLTLSWIAALALAVIALIYWEQTALLYILATLGVTALLIVVAMADLGRVNTPSAGSSADEASGTGTKLRSTFGTAPSSNN
jgi:predicted lysophospholipase L1 biosynthesis ABC-type transport system permease subunit